MNKIDLNAYSYRVHILFRVQMEYCRWFCHIISLSANAIRIKLKHSRTNVWRFRGTPVRRYLSMQSIISNRSSYIAYIYSIFMHLLWLVHKNIDVNEQMKYENAILPSSIIHLPMHTTINAKLYCVDGFYARNHFVKKKKQNLRWRG